MAKLTDLKVGDKVKRLGLPPFDTPYFIEGKEYEVVNSRKGVLDSDACIIDEDGDQWFKWELSTKCFEKVEPKQVEQLVKTNVYRFLYENGEYGIILIEDNTYLEALDYLEELTLDLGRFHKLTHLATLTPDELKLYQENS